MIASATFDIVLAICVALAGLLVATFLIYMTVVLARITWQTIRGEHDKSAGRFIFSSGKDKE